MSNPSLTLDTEDLARRYERVSAERQFKAGQVLIAALAIAPGEHILDIGCGTGLLAAYAAGRAGATGSITGIDPLPLRIELAQKKTRPNLSFKVGNAYDLNEFPEASFDVVYLNAVFHWLAEKLEALRQIRRVLKRGGRLGISIRSRGQRSQLQAIASQVLAHAPYSNYAEAATDRIHRVNASELQSLFGQTGFYVKKIEVRPDVQYHQTAEAAIEHAEASSFGNFLSHLPEDLRITARDEIKRELEQVLTPEGIRREGDRIVAVAIKP
ncbi:MAG: class I SAM-dependent methyltransferase [Candidatus Binataceae bacterium]